MLTLEKFEEASEIVKRVTRPTKLIYSEYLSSQTGGKVYLKPENMQYTGAYKLRGAYYKISTLSEEDRAKGLITASAGNHAQGVAYAAKEYIEDPVKFGATEHAVAYVQSTRHLQDDIVSFLKQHDDELDSMDIVVKDEAQKQKVIEVLKAEVEDIYITSSISQLVEISYKDAGKRSGVKFITEYLGLNPKQVAAFGDADNDIDMLEYAGCGIAMENASNGLLAVADVVTLHHDRDGVAYALKNILKCID